MTNIVTKSLAMMEDLEVGINKVTQTRNQLAVTGNRVYIPVPVDSDLALATIDVSKYNYAVKVVDNIAREYAYKADATSVDEGVQSNTGPGKWIDINSIYLRQDLAEPTGATEIGVAPGRTLADKNSDFICVLDKGAKADSTNGINGTDSTAAFLTAIAECKTTGKALSIPKASAGYKLTQTIDVRGITILDNDATLYISHAGIGVIFGGNASVPNNPKQYFGSVIRVTGTASRANPDMRGIGVKGQNIYVERCDYFQLYADDSAAVHDTDYSSAYSMFFLKKVDTIELYSAPGTQGWINENTFHLNRTNKILFADGLYSHNHNKFHDGTMEGLGLIDLPIGNNFYSIIIFRYINSS